MKFINALFNGLLLFTLLLTCSKAKGQAGPCHIRDVWETGIEFRDSIAGEIFAFREDVNGGWIVLYNHYYATGEAGPALLKVDSAGKEVWKQIKGAQGQLQLGDVAQDKAGNYYVVGVESIGPDQERVVGWKYDVSGQEVRSFSRQLPTGEYLYPVRAYVMQDRLSIVTFKQEGNTIPIQIEVWDTAGVFISSRKYQADIFLDPWYDQVYHTDSIAVLLDAYIGSTILVVDKEGDVLYEHEYPVQSWIGGNDVSYTTQVASAAIVDRKIHQIIQYRYDSLGLWGEHHFYTVLDPSSGSVDTLYDKHLPGDYFLTERAIEIAQKPVNYTDLIWHRFDSLQNYNGRVYRFDPNGSLTDSFDLNISLPNNYDYPKIYSGTNYHVLFMADVDNWWGIDSLRLIWFDSDWSLLQAEKVDLEDINLLHGLSINGYWGKDDQTLDYFSRDGNSLASHSLRHDVNYGFTGYLEVYGGDDHKYLVFDQLGTLYFAAFDPSGNIAWKSKPGVLLDADASAAGLLLLHRLGFGPQGDTLILEFHAKDGMVQWTKQMDNWHGANGLKINGSGSSILVRELTTDSIKITLIDEQGQQLIKKVGGVLPGLDIESFDLAYDYTSGRWILVAQGHGQFTILSINKYGETRQLFTDVGWPGKPVFYGDNLYFSYNQEQRIELVKFDRDYLVAANAGINRNARSSELLTSAGGLFAVLQDNSFVSLYRLDVSTLEPTVLVVYEYEGSMVLDGWEMTDSMFYILEHRVSSSRIHPYSISGRLLTFTLDGNLACDRHLAPAYSTSAFRPRSLFKSGEGLWAFGSHWYNNVGSGTRFYRFDISDEFNAYPGTQPENNLLVYPNPSSGPVRIYVNLEGEGDHSIVCYNSLGQKVKEWPLDEDGLPLRVIQWDLNNQENPGSGVYHLTLFQNGKVIASERLVRTNF